MNDEGIKTYTGFTEEQIFQNFVIQSNGRLALLTAKGYTTEQGIELLKLYELSRMRENNE